MTITTIQGVKDGLLPPMYMRRQAGGSSAHTAGAFRNTHCETGERPSSTQAAPSSGLAGAALTAPFVGAFPFTDPVSGETLIGQLAVRAYSQGPTMLIDRLWQDSGLSISSTSAQTVNSVAFPARDNNGSTNGEGVYIAVEVSSSMGTGTPSLSMSYTNSAGVSGRTGVNITSINASSQLGSIHLMGLQAGDTGVRSIQTFTNSATWGVMGAIHLVAFRPLAEVAALTGAQNPFSFTQNKSTNYENAATLAGLRVLNDSCLQLWSACNGGSSAWIVAAQLALSQG